MKNYFKSWFLNTKGATAIEYGLIAVAIAVAISAVVFLIGGDLGDTFTTINDKMG